MAYAYIINGYAKNGRHIFTKVGKTIDVKQRMAGIRSGNAKLAKIRVAQAYATDTEDSALVLESMIRGYFKRKHTIISGMDYFKPFTLTEADEKQINRYFEIVKEYETWEDRL